MSSSLNPVRTLTSGAGLQANENKMSNTNVGGVLNVCCVPGLPAWWLLVSAASSPHSLPPTLGSTPPASCTSLRAHMASPLSPWAQAVACIQNTLPVTKPTHPLTLFQAWPIPNLHDFTYFLRPRHVPLSLGFHHLGVSLSPPLSHLL